MEKLEYRMIYLNPYSGGRKYAIMIVEALGDEAALLTHYLTSHDLVVNWGMWGQYPRTLNPCIIGNKLVELEILQSHGVPTLEFKTHLPPANERWLGRSLRHAYGRDFSRTVEPDFWTKFITVVREFRVHIFRGLSIRAGLKFPVNQNAHPWVHSRKFGWHITYGDRCQQMITANVREVAKAAVRAVGYDFGAVDVALTASGAVVLEVNSAPGLEPSTASAYARAIRSVYDNGRS